MSNETPTPLIKAVPILIGIINGISLVKLYTTDANVFRSNNRQNRMNSGKAFFMILINFINAFYISLVCASRKNEYWELQYRIILMLEWNMLE